MMSLNFGCPIFSAEDDENSGEQDIGDCQGKHQFPAKIHQLIVAKTRDCPADDDEEHQHERHLQTESKYLKDAHPGISETQIVYERDLPSAKVERRDDCAGREHVCVFGQEKKAELQAAVLRMVTADELGLSLGK